ncbi:hypothetical protein M011DRAFT_466382 [Sporormia fimetaria CBS 119925]|uniref:Uncharacterized protein n=1 Tax=Sporormia fimetaria CBS 119925 TaxID=1340428 RepID=A0A6A6VEE4_9PLEO|nr:hypothetical protein M011DRAFT_466382 [Sporormia fimetaria CBS 119925]
MNFASFLDTAAGPSNMPRQAPSPSAPTGPNGNPNATNGAGVPLVNGLPSGGLQTDMNHLWTVVQHLSQLLEENRAQAAAVQSGVQALALRGVDEGAGSGGAVGSSREGEGEEGSNGVPSPLQTLTTQLTTAQSRILALNTTNTALRDLLTDYENAITLLLDKLRPYAYNQTQTVLSLHKHYQELLDKERSAAMQVRLEHADWQAGLGRVAEYARAALANQNEADLPLRKEIKELKEENRVLRRLAGWKEREESGDEGEGQEGKM